MPPYHKPLDADQHEIRLVKIHPGPKDSSIECSILHHSLVHPPKYTALSYSCGDINDLREVTVNGAGALIYANLEAALRQLRELGVDLVWADTISINQEDKQEKSLQIRAMRYVYLKAAHTYAWLGQDNEDHIVETMEFLDFILAIAGAEFPASGRRLGPVLQRSLSCRMTIFPGSNPAHRFGMNYKWLDRYFESLDLALNFKKLMSLLQCEYWKRRWIIQELAVASNVSIFCCSRTMRYTDLEMAIAICRQSASWSQQHQHAAQHLQIIFGIRHEIHEKGPPRLLDLLWQTHLFKSHDVRDNLFALIGLSSDGSQLVPLPSYVQDPHVIARDLTKALLRTRKCFNILSLIGSKTSSTSSLPSWSINWLDPNEVPGCVWRAAGQRSLVLPAAVIDRSWEDSNVLCVRGITSGKVVQLTSTLNFPEVEESVVLRMPQAHSEQDALKASKASLRYYGQEKVEHAVLRCLFENGVSYCSETSRPTHVAGPYSQFLRRAHKSILTADTLDVESSDLILKIYGRWMLANEAFILNEKSLFHQPDQQHPDSLITTTHAIIYTFGCCGLVGFIFVAVYSEARRLLWIILSAVFGLVLIVVVATIIRRQKTKAKSIQGPYGGYAARGVNQRLAMTDRGVAARVPPETRFGDLLCVLAGCDDAIVLREALAKDGHTQYRIVGRSASLSLNETDFLKYGVLSNHTLKPDFLGPCAVSTFDNLKEQLRINGGGDPWWQDFELI